ncbi:MAG: zinc ribbon domain-containing protein [Candidatus Eremiobacteraeota bacterium]|nr:zinc ribbon domain-containing protein [Candidatus Eremiobacteraeota bacterium]
MPIYEYQAKDHAGKKACAHCRERFEFIQKMSDPPLENCPRCGAPIRKLISRFSMNVDMDSRAKEAGMHKLVRKDKGVYEKEY